MWVSREGSGASITGSGSSYIYRAADGTEITYGIPEGILSFGQNTGGIAFCGGSETLSCNLLPLSKKLPNGRTQHYHWTLASVCDTFVDPNTGEVPCTYFPRLSSIVNESAYIAKIKYATDSYTQAGPPPDWFKRISVKFVNQNKEYCDPDAANCDGLVQNWATATISYPSAGVTQITDASGGVWRLTAGNGTIAIKRPTATTSSTTATNPGGIVSSVTRNGVATNYSRSVASGVVTTVRTNALSGTATFRTRTSEGRPYQITNEAGETTTYAYDASSRPTEVTDPQGVKRQYIYDARGNVTQITIVPKPGSGLPNIVSIANYDASCTNPVKCNQPNWTRDAAGNQTDYSYDPTSGMLVSVASPAPSPGGTRPTTNIVYSTATGYSGELLKLMVSVGRCRTSASCAGTADETRSTTNFGTVSANNLQPVSITSGAGDGSLTATTGFSYDNYGNVASVDGPLAGTGDTTTYRYDLSRRLTGIISADPDGTGPLNRRATRLIYNADGQVVLSEIGTVAGVTDTNWAGFTSVAQTETNYDLNGRKVADKQKALATTYSVTQYSYDALGRLDCSAQRMNTAAFASLPASACSLGTAGSFGPDRISKVTYDALGRTLRTTTAYGTADQSDDASVTYASGGLVATVTDANNNRTSYEYDGYNRLVTTRFPVAVQGALASSATDYEQLAYDANSNIISRRLRDGQTIGYVYDNLGRVVTRTENGTTTRSYAYTLLGQLASSAWSGGGSAEILSYDALGRLTSRAEPYTTLNYQYDAAGRRTRVSWPDGLYAAYNYDLLGEMTSVLENGSTTLATYSYDDLGRRTSLVRGNGVASYYSYDPASRLTCLTHDLAGGGSINCNPTASGQDNVTTYSYNPAGQIVSRTSANDAYAWVGSINVDRNYTANGLNQYTASGAVSLGYDGRGNLTSSGASTYSYDAVNHLVGTNGAASALEYGSLDELQGYTISTGYPRFASDEGNIIGEYLWNTNPSLQRRYVYGAGTDEPLVWYEGTGTSDRRWLVADERGSVVAVTNASGTATAINSYDEYGIPGSGNLGRFQYTGQAWLSELGLSYYKARMYSPTLGRFLQTDPIGYADGLNWYNYVGSDPVNATDPTGNTEEDEPEIVVTGTREKIEVGISNFAGGSYGYNLLPPFGSGDPCNGPFSALCTGAPDDIVVTATKAKAKPNVGAAQQNDQSKPLPWCLQNFLKGRLKSNPANIRLHQGSPFELTGNSVTFGNDVYLAGDTYGRTDRGATIHKFHEIQHTSQYARGYSALNQAFAYVAFGGHDASPFEQAADTFAQDTYNGYKAAGLDKTCPF